LRYGRNLQKSLFLSTRHRTLLLLFISRRAQNRPPRILRKLRTTWCTNRGTARADVILISQDGCSAVLHLPHPIMTADE
jgi:hypothetical protein